MFRQYLNSRKNLKDQSLTNQNWTLSHIDHPLQIDGHSCGIFVLKVFLISFDHLHFSRQCIEPLKKPN